MRVYNFSAGPAALPLPVLEQARDELLDWQGGASVMEVSHRSRDFMAVAEQAEADLRELLAIPSNYRVLFMQGGATAQFSAVPMNLASPGAMADYVNTGHWSERAIKEARRFVSVGIAADEAAGRIHDRAGPGHAESLAEGGLPALHAERNHRRRRVSLHPRNRPGSARRGHVFDDPVAAARRQPVRTHLCRRPEEYRAFRDHGRHRSR